MAGTARTGPGIPPRPRRAPVRTCVGCRKRAEQSALLRVVARQEPLTPRRWSLLPDGRRRSAGRGASVHPDPQCLQTAIARRAFARALRLPAGAEVDVSAVEAHLAQQGT